MTMTIIYKNNPSMSVQGKSWVMFYPVSSTLVATLRGEFVTRRYYLNLRWFNFFPFVCDGMNDTNKYRTMLKKTINKLLETTFVTIMTMLLLNQIRFVMNAFIESNSICHDDEKYVLHSEEFIIQSDAIYVNIHLMR